MEDRRPRLPRLKGFDNGCNEAYTLAIKRLKVLRDIERQCKSSGATLKETPCGRLITLKYFGKDYLITLPQGKVLLKDSNEEAVLIDALFILHYFLNAKGTPPDKELLSFRDLPEGRVYHPTFYKRTIAPLLKRFGGEFIQLKPPALELDGHESNMGDLSFVFSPFDRISITLVFWEGDQDFPPEASYLFQSNITDYLPAEDIAYLCQVITVRLLSASS